MNKPSLLIVFLTVFIDLIGFGIVMPLLPLYSQKFGASGLMIGMIVASFSVMQFIFAPAWGTLSDRIGRRPVLLIGNAGSAAAYALFAVASSFEGDNGLWLLLISRIFAGICGASLSVAAAYIADVSPPEKRTRSMGLIGMAFGLGFIIGPVIGAQSAKYFGLPGPGWVAAGICAFNFLLAIFILAESLKPHTEPRINRVRFAQWAHTIRQPTIGFLVVLYFFATFCFAAFEVTASLLLKENMGYDATNIGHLFAYCGVLSALIQGGGIRPLVKMFGERKLVAMSLIILAIGLGWLPYVRTQWELYAALAFLAAGSGLHRPPTFGLISLNTPDHEQGATMGVAQSSSSLARIFAPMFAGTVYDLRPDLPYLICAGIAVGSGLVAWYVLVTRRPAVAETKAASP